MNAQKKFWFLVLIIFGGILSYGATAKAFGISPPTVRNDGLIPGSHFEQEIILVNGQPVEDLQATIKINVPGANDWFKIDKGLEFIMPAGQKQTKIVVSVDVPRSAAYARYPGNISVRVAPPSGGKTGQVSIAMGGQIDVDITTVDKKISDFKVSAVKSSDLEEGFKKWFLDFPGKIVFTMQIENTGNVEVTPDRVVMKIYDSNQTTLKQTLEANRIIGKVAPFKTDWVTAEFLTDLTPGSYWGEYEIYKGEEVMQKNRVHLSVMAHGAIDGYKGAGLMDLNNQDKMTLGGIALGGLCLLAFIIWLIVHLIRGKSRNTGMGGASGSVSGASNFSGNNQNL